MSALLTDEAVRAAVRGMTAESDHFEGHTRRGLAYALHHHATVGRAALLATVAEAILGAVGDPSLGWEDVWPEAEAVVTALVGEQSPDTGQTDEERRA